MWCSVLSHVWLLETLWTVPHQAPLSIGFSRPEYWSGLPCPPPGDLPNLGIKPTSFTYPTLAGRFFTTEPSGKLSASLIKGQSEVWSVDGDGAGLTLRCSSWLKTRSLPRLCRCTAGGGGHIDHSEGCCRPAWRGMERSRERGSLPRTKGITL